MAKFRVYVVETSYHDYTVEKSIVEKAGGELSFAECKSEDDIVEQCADAHALLLRQTQIGEKTFYLKPDGFLYDSLYDPATHKAKIIEIRFLSDAYFALLKKHPEIGRYLAEAKPMLLVLAGDVYRVAAATPQPE